MWSLDWKEARGLEGRLSNGYLIDRNIGTHKFLEQRADQLVAENSDPIQRLAEALLGKEWEGKKVFESGMQWSGSEKAKYLCGGEIAEILHSCGIDVQVVDAC